MTTDMGDDYDQAHIDVTAAMERCMDWFDANKVAYTGADLVAMARMVMKREQEIGDAAKRTAWERTHGIGDRQDA